MAHYTEKKYVDLLDEDKPIANQKFVCISFVSPEKIIEKKEPKVDVKKISTNT